MKDYILYFIKGLAVGAANIIPGVSGGTIALVTGIFEDLINSLKSIDIKAIKLFFSGRFKEFEEHTNFLFMLAVFGGAALGIYLIAFILSPLFANYPRFVWSFFFGLILASVYFVGKTIKKWTTGVIITFIIGTAVAVIISVMLNPAVENSSVWYVFICGIVAICSMILPGLSGSYVLLLMGNYELVMINAVKNLDLTILIPLLTGALFGLLAFSHLLSWVLKKFRDYTIAILTGFIFGSLGILWPWKNEITTFFLGKETTVGYEWFLPQGLSAEVFVSVALMLGGVLLIWFIEHLANKSSN